MTNASTGNADMSNVNTKNEADKRYRAVPRRYRGARNLGAKTSAQLLARGLGWFSIGLGVTELLAPGALSRSTGLGDSRGLVRGYGLRECAAGAAILASHDPEPWIISRIAGDVLDILTLAAARPRNSEQRRHRRAATLAVLGATALDVACANMLSGDKKLRPVSGVDYGDRSGFPKAPNDMRGKGRDVRLGNFPVKPQPATA